MQEHSFQQWFAKLTGHESPRSWQGSLVAEQTCRDRLIRIPTGLGKTEGVLAAWSYFRIGKNDDRWPRRLIWCLPMRVLVEQTREVARNLADRIPVPKGNRPTVHVAMGGEDAEETREWYLHPERPTIIIGTQDMLLSRAMNRGYASPRARWPMEFGLLNHDALWVMDEVQLMDVGLATSAQIQAFREEDRKKRLRPCHTWWMSATLQPKWLRSVDTAPHHDLWIQDPCEIAPNERIGTLWEIPKRLETTSIGQRETQAFAERILEEHEALEDGEYGRITLVVCNTVDRACETFKGIREAGREGDLELVHSRFRPHERERWKRDFLSRENCRSGVDRIIVATQVVEAGVDISAGCLITELAPWPSLVQRFGRCARYGGTGKIVVVDRGHDEKQSAPYDHEELESAWQALQQLDDVGITSLEAYEQSLSQEDRERLYPYSPNHLLLRREFDELFDTTPDLTGADLDISRFIRSDNKERDLQVFWIGIEKDKKGEKPNEPPEDYKPQRNELCAVPFLKAREWLCEKGKSKLKASKRAWLWDWIDGKWIRVESEKLLPGRVVCIASDTGGYSIERGFSPDSTEFVSPVETVARATQPTDTDDDQEESEQRNFTGWKTIACHTVEVKDKLDRLTTDLKLPQDVVDSLELAALFHDWGKSHPAFQNMLFRKRDNVERFRKWVMAKSEQTKSRIKARYFAEVKEADERGSNAKGSDERPGFRHELASALGLFSLLQTYAPNHPALLGPWSDVFSVMGKRIATDGPPPPPSSPLIQRLLDCSAEEFDLVAYLVASHHGKVRVGLHAAPKDQEYHDGDGRGLPIRGVRDGDQLPPVAIIPGEPELPAIALTLSPAAIGLSEKTGVSWRERCIGLTERHGPAALAFLEAILMAADRRASRLTISDPALASEGDA